MDLSTVAPGPRPFAPPLHEFAEEIGTDGAVTVRGGESAWGVGGLVDPAARAVRAPAGIVEFDPAEMTVRVGAGTTVSDLQSDLAVHRQEVVLPVRRGGTVGGALCVGWSDIRRLGRGPVRDALLEASVVNAGGQLVRCGGPTVKNVTGYDLCRVLVGSLGTLALIGEAVLRTQPRRDTSVWMQGDAPPEAVLARTNPSACLWDGTTSWTLLEGHGSDVGLQIDALAGWGLVEVAGPPELPPYRWSVDPARVGEVVNQTRARTIAEVGVGTVHSDEPGPPRPVSTGVRSLNQRMKQIFDPTGRLNPGRDVLAP